MPHRLAVNDFLHIYQIPDLIRDSINGFVEEVFLIRLTSHV